MLAAAQILTAATKVLPVTPLSQHAEDSIDVLWWNVGDFFHFERSQTHHGSRWPQSRVDYDEKCSRVDAALTALFRQREIPSIIGLGEITQCAARELKDRLLPSYELISLDVKRDNPTLQVAILHCPDLSRIKYVERPPIVVPFTPRGTRPMAVLDAVFKGNRIRVITCHWQARFNESSENTRHRIADHLSTYSFDFLSRSRKEKRNLVIIGDLNDEPFELSSDILNAHRHREGSRSKAHWADADVKRVHLYNCSWRLLGEKHAHTGLSADGHMVHVAGTYYWADKKSWHNLDQLIVSGGLLSDDAPYLDEDEVKVISLPEFVPDGMPMKFSKTATGYQGLSDHLPIVATIKIGDINA